MPSRSLPGCLIGLAAMLAFAAPAQEKAPVPSVTVAPVITKDVTPQYGYVGRVEAIDRVELRARVEGYLEQRLFQEGHYVTHGQPLFVIEKAPYEVVVAERRAELAAAEASLKNARADLARKQDLRGKKVLSQADLDTAEAAEATASADVLRATAALRRAELDLGYTEVVSPIDGQVSRARYSIGNLVGPSSEPLAVVTSVDPIYVIIAVSEKALMEARRRGEIDLENPPVAPSLALSDGSRYEHAGRFDYLDTQVNPTTDTLLARAVFPNPDKVLVPGQIVDVSVKRIAPISALVVPQAGVQEDQKGFFVLVVNQADKVEVRRVQVGDHFGTDWVIEQGLAQGERVIVQGLQKVRPDMVVNPISGED